MPTYIALVNFTPSGFADIKEQPAKLAEIRRRYQAAGCVLKAVYLVMGKYDIVTISEAPDDETLAKLFLSFAIEGTVRSETLRAFTEEEYLDIIATLP